MSLKQITVGMLWAGVMVASAGVVVGQEFPTKPLRIVTSSPGGGSDFTSRIIAAGLTRAWGQPVITEPSALFPGVPTIAASGLPGFEALTMTAVFAPAKTPAPIINRLNQEIVRTLNQPDAKEKFLKIGVEVAASSPQVLAATVKSEVTKWGKLISDLGIRPE